MVPPHDLGIFTKSFVRIPGSGSEKSVLFDLGKNADIQKLIKENKVLKKENELLKKQITLFKQLLLNPKRLNSVMQRIAEKIPRSLNVAKKCMKNSNILEI